MSIENSASLGVFNSYGPRGKQDGRLSGGAVQTSGIEGQAVVYIKGDDFDGGTSFDTQLVLPEGAVPVEATFHVEEAFTLGNADNVFNIGTNGSESTNGFSIANPDSAGVTVDTSPAGTWASALTADTTIGVSVTGTTAAVTAGSGEAKVVIKYRKI